MQDNKAIPVLKSKNYVKGHVYHFYSMNYIILFVCSVVCNVLGHFFTVGEKCVSLSAMPFSTLQYLN